MGIEKCENCGSKFKYKSILKAAFTNNKLVCQSCRVSPEMTLSSSFVFILLLMLPSSMAAIPESTKENILKIFTLESGLILALIYVAVVIIIAPYIFRYKVKEESKTS